MLSAYPACFFKEENGYSAVFPDLNYLATCGKTLEETVSMSAECLAGYLYSCKTDGSKPAPPSAADKISPSAVADELGIVLGEAFVNTVTVDVDEYVKNHLEKPVKKTLTLPAWMNNAAMEYGINLSQLLQEALKERLKINL